MVEDQESAQEIIGGGDRLKLNLQRETFYIDQMKATNLPQWNEDISYLFLSILFLMSCFPMFLLPTQVTSINLFQGNVFWGIFLSREGSKTWVTDWLFTLIGLMVTLLKGLKDSVLPKTAPTATVTHLLKDNMGVFTLDLQCFSCKI